MALTDKSFFNYGLEITTSNYYIPFKNSGGGSEIQAVIPVGFYTRATILTAIATAMNTADPTNTYTCTIVRGFTSAGTGSPRTGALITIATSGSFLSLLWGSSAVAASSAHSILGFPNGDQTGETSYQSSTYLGTTLLTSWYGFNYQRPDANLRTIGSVNIAADGTKEVVWWSVQQFISVEFRFEPQAYVLSDWLPLLQWMAKGRPFEFTPITSSFSTVYSVTLEKSMADSKGLGFQMKEMLPDFPFQYQTGALEFRLLAGTY